MWRDCDSLTPVLLFDPFSLRYFPGDFPALFFQFFKHYAGVVMFKIRTIIFVLMLSGLAIALVPVAELPRVYIDTTWTPPTGGTTWAAHTSAQLSSALTHSSPGDLIVLDAGATYIGNFQLPAKINPNNKWIYVISSQLARLPAGTRVSPASAVNMPKIVTSNVAPAFDVKGGANHWRFAGLEMTSASTQGCNPTHVPPINCYSFLLIGPYSQSTPLADSFTIDRCYLHGTANIDLQRAILANMSNFAIVDSYISDVHMIGTDTQAVGAWYSPGPFKLVNNHLEAAGENVMFGGAGGASNPYIPSDIEVRNNEIYKPLSWVPLSLGSKATMVVKNAFEVKSGRRILFYSNTIENVWAAGQDGSAMVLTVRTGQSGDIAVVNDLTISSNVFKNVVSGIDGTASDDLCGPGYGYSNCHNAGSQDRWVIQNNVFTFYDPTLPGGLRNLGFGLGNGPDRIHGTWVPMRDILFQHNTTVAASSTPCWNSIYFGVVGLTPPYSNVTNNVWILDNALCRQPTGDNQQQGIPGLTQYMGTPSTPPYDLTQRFYGNVMYVAAGNTGRAWPPHSYATTVPFTYVNPASFDYQLLTPYWTDTSDGNLAGISYTAIPRTAAGSNSPTGSGTKAPTGSVTNTTILPPKSVSSGPSTGGVTH